MLLKADMVESLLNELGLHNREAGLLLDDGSSDLAKSGGEGY